MRIFVVVLIAITFNLVVISQFSYAGSIDYRCKITQSASQATRLDKNAPNLTDDLVTLKTAQKAIGYGQEFTIIKRTGEISGSGWVSSAWAEKIMVINQGNNEDSFTELLMSPAQADGSRHSMYIEVKQYSIGETKPFLAFGYGGSVLSGICQSE